MKKQLLTVAAYVALQFGLSGINTAQAQYTYTMANQTWTGFNFTQLPAGFTGTLTSVSVNVTLNASVNYTYADDICVYVAGSPLALGGLLQVGGFSNLQATQRYSWANGGSDAPGTTCIGTVNLTTPLVFTGASSDPFFWIGNGYGAAGTSGTWTGSITLNGVSLGATCTAPTLSATTVAAICTGDANGSINLTTTGGSPTPLTYAWSNGGSTEDLSGLTAGTYTVTVTTQTGGCSATASYTVAAGAPNVTYYADADGDTYGNAGVSQTSCTGAPVGYVSNSTDCNDGNAGVNPGVTEVCNGIDDNCSGVAEEGLTFTNYYADADGDGFGAGTATNACAQPAGYAASSSDCNDTNASVNPGATEVCNGIDDNCSGVAEEGLTFTNYYADADGDGFGAGTATNACAQPAGYVINNLDCNDVNSAISPTTIWYLDVDADGSYVSTYMSCTSPGANYNTTGGIVGDCNDNNPLIRPGVTETCNSIDDDCDALIDENSSNTY